MINMTRDVVVPVSGAFELFDAFPCPKRIAFWEGGHTELPPESMAMARAFFGRVIARASEPAAGGVDAW
jgi:hypothetical protein